MSRILPSTSKLYAAPPAALVARIIAERGIEVAMERWSESQTEDSLYKLAASVTGRRREDADRIIETTRKLGQIKLAARELKMSETAIRTVFERAGLKIPKLPMRVRIENAMAAKRAKAAARTAARLPAGTPISIRRPEQMLLFDLGTKVRRARPRRVGVAIAKRVEQMSLFGTRP